MQLRISPRLFPTIIIDCRGSISSRTDIHHPFVPEIQPVRFGNPLFHWRSRLLFSLFSSMAGESCSLISNQRSFAYRHTRKLVAICTDIEGHKSGTGEYMASYPPVVNHFSETNMLPVPVIGGILQRKIPILRRREYIVPEKNTIATPLEIKNQKLSVLLPVSHNPRGIFTDRTSTNFFGDKGHRSLWVLESNDGSTAFNQRKRMLQTKFPP